jgi:predicted  nucleic acid-binding Zn-ribbon protein
LWIEYEYRSRKQVAQRRKSCEFHDTWQSAYDHLIATAQLRITSARRSLHQAEAALAELEALSEPLSPAITTPVATQVP